MNKPNRKSRRAAMAGTLNNYGNVKGMGKSRVNKKDEPVTGTNGAFGSSPLARRLKKEAEKKGGKA